MKVPFTKYSPLIKHRIAAPIGSEVTPFVFHDRLYRLENFKRCEDFPGQPVAFRFHEDGFWIRDVEADRVVGIPLRNHYFASALVWENRVHVFCGDLQQAEYPGNRRALFALFFTALGEA